MSLYRLIAQCSVQSEVYMEQCWLCSLTAAGRKDQRYLSFTHLGCISLLLKELHILVHIKQHIGQLQSMKSAN